MHERIKERIKELAEQTGLAEGADVRCGFIYPSGMEKFAELIIADAINIVENRFMGDLNREDMEVRRCVDALKEHFGVDN
jgi:hypothetical protein